MEKSKSAASSTGGPVPQDPCAAGASPQEVSYTENHLAVNLGEKKGVPLELTPLTYFEDIILEPLGLSLFQKLYRDCSGHSKCF